MYKLPKEFKKGLNKIIYEHVFEKCLKEFFNNKKEVKTMKYFEVRVVKMKKGKNQKLYTQYCRYPQSCEYQKLEENKPDRKQKGNWINGENLDKIKFPCFCSYRIKNVVCGYGVIMIAFKKNNQIYDLINIDGQTLQGTNKVATFYRLKELIEEFNIHILKGKIIIYEEE